MTQENNQLIFGRLGGGMSWTVKMTDEDCGAEVTAIQTGGHQ